MARQHPSLGVEQDLFIDMCALIESLVCLNETAVKNGLAGTINHFKLHPGLVHVAELRRERMGGFTIRHDYFSRDLFAGLERDLVFSLRSERRDHLSGRLALEREDV